VTSRPAAAQRLCGLGRVRRVRHWIDRECAQTDQESRSAAHRAAANVTGMDITYRDTLGFEVSNDVA
jgi:hypothetical protein